MCRLKSPTVISLWLLIGFHPASRSVHSTPADNTRKRVWQYIEKEKEKKKGLSIFTFITPRRDIMFFVCFVALRPKSTAMVIAGQSVHLTTLFLGRLEQAVNQ